jgi:hypothetical protein
VLSKDVVKRESSEYLYFAAIEYINTTKTGFSKKKNRKRKKTEKTKKKTKNLITD